MPHLLVTNMWVFIPKYFILLGYNSNGYKMSNSYHIIIVIIIIELWPIGLHDIGPNVISWYSCQIFPNPYDILYYSMDLFNILIVATVKCTEFLHYKALFKKRHDNRSISLLILSAIGLHLFFLVCGGKCRKRQRALILATI